MAIVLAAKSTQSHVRAEISERRIPQQAARITGSSISVPSAALTRRLISASVGMAISDLTF